ncbi:hypothetical protein DJ71_24425 [Halorubrum sp. E3]|nr:hypothetical protein DJ71_24425 [Halorubrum sp. E3]
MALPIDALPVADLRAIGGLLAVLVLLYWTYERLVGQGSDPVVRSSMSSDTGSASILLSGSKAVMALAVGAGALLLAPVAGGPIVDASGPVMLGLGGLVVAHWIVEKEERE